MYVSFSRIETDFSFFQILEIITIFHCSIELISKICKKYKNIYLYIIFVLTDFGNLQ